MVLRPCKQARLVSALTVEGVRDPVMTTVQGPLPGGETRQDPQR